LQSHGSLLLRGITAAVRRKHQLPYFEVIEVRLELFRPLSKLIAGNLAPNLNGSPEKDPAIFSVKVNDKIEKVSRWGEEIVSTASASANMRTSRLPN